MKLLDIFSKKTVKVDAVLINEIEELRDKAERLNTELYVERHKMKAKDNLNIKLSETIKQQEKDVKTLENELKRVTNDYNELSEAKTDNKDKRKIKQLKETIVELNKQLENSEQRRHLAFSLSQAQSFISDSDNKNKAIECLSHNFKLYVDGTQASFNELADKYDVTRETIRRIYSGARGTSVNTFEKMEGDMCDFFGCMPFELVSEKLEVSK